MPNPGTPIPALTPDEVSAYLGTSSAPSKGTPALSPDEVSAYLNSTQVKPPEESPTPPAQPKHGIGSFNTLRNLARGITMQPSADMLAPQPQQSAHPATFGPSNYTENISRGSSANVNPVAQAIEAGAFRVVDTFTGGLGSTLLKPYVGGEDPAANAQQRTSTGNTWVDEATNTALGLAPYANPLAAITGPAAMAGGLAKTGIDVARGDESIGAGLGDAALLPATLIGFGAAGKIGGRVLRTLAMGGVGAASTVASAGIHGELPTVPQLVGGVVGGAAFGVTGHGEAPAAQDNAPQTPQRAFVDNMAPYAERASQATGLPTEFIMGQWAHESNFGQSKVAKQTGNLAGIKTEAGAANGTLDYKGYSDPTAFTDDYIKTINHARYGEAREIAANGGTAQDIAASLQKHGYAEDPSYGKKVARRVRQVAGNIPTTQPADQNATQTWNQPENSQQEHSGTFEGTAAPADGTEVRPEESTPPGRSDSPQREAQEPKQVAPDVAISEPSNHSDNGIQIDQSVLRGQPEESVSGGNVEGSDSPQYRAIDGGVAEDQENRQDNAEGRGPRPLDLTGDSGDESLRQGGAGANEEAPRENDAQPSAVEGTDYKALPALPEIARGKETKVISPTGEEYPAYYAVVDKDSITPSHNPRNFSPDPSYPPDVQDRDYTHSKDEQAKVVDNGSNLKPAKLISTAAEASVGPPTVDAKGRVIAGNGRDMSTTLAFAHDGTRKADYKRELVNQASTFGLDPEAIRSQKNPTLVRVMPNVELKADQPSSALVREMNLPDAFERGATSDAISAGRSISPEQHEAIGQILEKHETLGEAFSDQSTQKQLVTALTRAKIITRENRPRLVEDTQRGARLSENGKDFVTDLMASRVLPDADLARSTPPEVRQKIAKAALPLAQAGRYEGWSLEHPIREAIGDINAQKASGMNAADWQAQMSFDREPLSRAGEAMRNLLADKRQTPLRDFAEQYAAEAKADKGESSSDMFEKPVRDPSETLVKLSERATGRKVEAETSKKYTRDKFVRDLESNTKLSPEERTAFDKMLGGEEEKVASSTNPAPGELTPPGSLASSLPGADVIYRDIHSIVTKEIIPAVRKAAETAGEVAGGIQRTLAPSSRGEIARIMKGIMRENLADYARKSDALNDSFKSAASAMDKLPIEAKNDFIDRMERGQEQQTPALETIASSLRDLRDDRIKQVQALGTGKLQSLIENYFPHMWKNPDKAMDAFRQAYAKRPFEGNKSWTRKRVLEYDSDGRALGLERVTDNPVEMAMLRAHQMDKFVMAHKVMNEAKELGLSKYKPVFEPIGPGETKINDAIGTVYGNPNIKLSEYVDKAVNTALDNTINKLDVNHERKFNAGPGKIGWARRTGDEMVTQHATDTQVKAHELGHVLDAKYGLWDKLNQADRDLAPLGKNGQRLKTGPITKELRALSDKTIEENPSDHRKSYARNRYEKMAHMLEAYVHAPELFKETAPETYKVFHGFLDSHEELHELRDVKPGLRIAEGEGATMHVPGQIINGYHVMPDDAARLINNYLSPGIIEKSAAFRSFRTLANTMNQFQLGWSGFHAGFVTIDGMTSRVALGIYQGAHGQVGEGLRTVATSFTAPIQGLMEGNRMYREWVKPGSEGEAYGKLVTAMVQAGGRAKMDSFYGGDQWNKMKAAWNDSQGPIESVLRAGLRLPLALTEKSMAPIQQWFVPRMKMGLFAQAARTELKLLGPDASLADTRDALGKAWDSIDNRLGQLVYDNLFWSKTTKDVAMLSVRSVGWNLGTWRELGGGAVDFAKFGKDLVTPGAKADFTHRMSYVVALPAVAAIIGAVTQKLLTGQNPGELKDYLYPKNGATDEMGAPARLALPTYMKDVYSYYDDTHKALTIGGNPFRTVMNKLHPALGLVSEMLENRDYYGVEIRNSDDPILQQVKEVALHVAQSFEPFAYKGIVKNISREAFSGKSLLPMIGVTPAPNDLNESDAEQLMSKFAEESRPQGTRTTEQKEHTDAKYRLESDIRKGDQADAAKVKTSGVLSPAEIKAAPKEALIPRDAARFKGLPLEEKMKVYELMSPKDRSMFAGYDRNGFRMTVRTRLEETYREAVARGSISPEDKPRIRANKLRLMALPYNSLPFPGITHSGQ